MKFNSLPLAASIILFLGGHQLIAQSGKKESGPLPRTFLLKSQINLPITWNDSALVDYSTVDFGGNQSLIGSDPANPSNLVLKVIKSTAAEIWAGSTLGTVAGFSSVIPFSQGNTSIRTRLFSPNVSMQIRLKAEDSNDPTISVETIASTTIANGWEVLTFDFANQAPGTNPINFNNSYNKLSMFFNFGIDGATAGSKTFYLDDVEIGAGPPPVKQKINLPITWDDTAHVDYSTTDFAGNLSVQATDPLNSSNLVLKINRTEQSLTYAGTTFGTDFGLLTAIPFSENNNLISVRIFSPEVGVPVRLKVENIAGGLNCETDKLTTVANQWEDITFDFANPATGTPPLNYSGTYNKLVIFFNFGQEGSVVGNKIYYVDDAVFGTFTANDKAVLKPSMEIFPNPNSGLFRVKGSFAASDRQTLTLVDIMGREVYQSHLSGSELNQPIHIPGLTSGLYHCTIAGNGQTAQSRLVIK